MDSTYAATFDKTKAAEAYKYWRIQGGAYTNGWSIISNWILRCADIPPPPPPPFPPAPPPVLENVMLKDGAFGDATTFEYKASHGKESYTAQHKYMADGKDSTVANDWQSETGAFHPCSGTNCGTTGWVQVRDCQLPHMFAHSPHAEDALPMHSSDLSPSSKPSLVLLRRAGDASESGDMPGRGGHRLCGWITHARHVRVDHGIEG